MDMSKKPMSFWNLISGIFEGSPGEINIIVPDLQRDYAEGRSDSETTQIRKNLISDLVSSLRDEEDKSLNFIYGTLVNNNFTPVDGQQRLTTLYLLHWYVFVKAEAEESYFEILRRFSYQTRLTTEDFCNSLTDVNNISKLKSDETECRISERIKNQNWFTGNIAADPSVQSMLVVIDNIESELKDANYQDIFEKLTADNCLINFVYLNIGEHNVEDLYIKMNSRGKYLTNFENFKAKLQPSEGRKTILNAVFDDDEKSVEFIGRVNNEYSNYFYKLCGNDKFDSAMMNFFISVIKCDQIAYVAGINEIKSSDYRDIFNSTDVGSVFYERFVKSPVTQWREKNTEKNNKFDKVEEPELRECLKKSIKKIDYILSMLSSCDYNEKDDIVNKKFKWYNSDEVLDLSSIIKNSNKNKLTAKYHLTQYAIFEYVYKFKPDLSKKDELNAFCMWKRFVINLLTNAKDSKGDGFADTGDTCETLGFFSYIIKGLTEGCRSRYKDLNSEISSLCSEYSSSRKNDKTQRDSYPVSISRQMEEEMLKFKLMTESNWEQRITSAERYFYDGQIMFLFKYFKGDSEDYRISDFDECFELSKKLFRGNKAPNFEYINWSSLQTAAFRSDDNSKDNNSYLVKQTNWKMHIDDTSNSSYKEMLSGMDMKKIFLTCRNSADLNASLQKVESREFNSDEEWKSLLAGNLIDEMIKYNDCEGNNTFSFLVAFKNDCTLLLTGAVRTSSPNMEINTFRLYCEINDDCDKKLNFQDGNSILDSKNEKPLRYVETKFGKVGYSPIKNKFVNIDSPDEIFTYNEAINFLSGCNTK